MTNENTTVNLEEAIKEILLKKSEIDLEIVELNKKKTDYDNAILSLSKIFDPTDKIGKLFVAKERENRKKSIHGEIKNIVLNKVSEKPIKITELAELITDEMGLTEKQPVYTSVYLLKKAGKIREWNKFLYLSIDKDLPENESDPEEKASVLSNQALIMHIIETSEPMDTDQLLWTAKEQNPQSKIKLLNQSISSLSDQRKIRQNTLKQWVKVEGNI